MTLTICLWKWKRPARVDFRHRRVPYTTDHVNKMVRMLKRHLTRPHRLVCFTDDPEGVECETLPIPAPDLLKYGACWHRLWLFSDEAKELGEAVVSMDIDTVIVDNIDPLFEKLPRFKIWKGSYAGILYCGSIYAIRTGQLPWVWDWFREDGLSAKYMKLNGGKYEHLQCREAGHRIGSDQAWIALMLPNEATWTSADGVVSYRLECLNGLPPGARLVNFHGLEDPSLARHQAESPWIKVHYQ